MPARPLACKKFFERTGYPPGQWTLYKVLWLKNNEPQLYEQIYKIVLVQDYLLYKLTGNLVMAEGSGTMDRRARHRQSETVGHGYYQCSGNPRGYLG